MDSNSSVKTRKPYTITKQRERWTDDEHNSFLEALKLYGRAWQRIEEHIGTKTAVQIRSHAQKFFTKLEKEAAAKGIPIGQALDVEIPPPRPKRKPNYPYPRKTDPKTHLQLAEKDEKQTTLVSSLQLLDLETKPLTEKTSHKEKLENEKTSAEVQNSISNESYVTNETRKHQEPDQDGVKHPNITSNNIFSDNLGNLTTDIQTCPRHVPVQVVDVNQGIMAKTSVPTETPLRESNVNKSGEVYEHPNLSVNISAASEISGHHNSATFHPYLTPNSDNQDSYRSFLHFSSAIPSLIVSSLLQNPAAHAAASFAAKFWHPVNPEASSADSYSRDRLNADTTTPSMAAIAAATVAAATAWWSAHGLLPVCTPFYQGGYSCAFDRNLVNKAPSEGILQEEKLDKKNIEFVADLSSSEDSEKKSISEVSPVGTKDSSKLTGLGKQVDQSSCGSNTTSSSEIDMSVLEKDGKETEETKAADVKEPVSRRGRSVITPNESWKEVSEEGRLAFQALFSREVLPQSFSDIHTVAEKGQPNTVNISELDRNRMSHRHTGFKPYKWCSIDAKESSKIVSTGNQNDEKGPKRMRVATEAST